ncbi:glycerophosphodiester phosphodiesterase [Candidatus Pseudothioglobus singularis]|nr:glycerophosphodiester phosphodiesterase [Candidatus Pseudothioglobus singularis]
MKIIAHRGASRYAPENTMPAFQLAYEMQADGIELDVHLTKDRVPVIIHDEHVGRTTNGKGFVRDFTYSELKKLDAGSWFSPKFIDTKILSLEELLHWIRSKDMFLNIELKNNKYDYPELEPIVYEMVKHHQVLERTCFSTFNPTSIHRLRKLDHHAEIALLTSKKTNDLIGYAKKLGANAIHIQKNLIGRKLAREAKERNMPIRVYTVNKPFAFIRLNRYHLSGIITDVPDIALKYTTFFRK